jgi:NAD(P)-dependent dehydrogenase (short-subunit alcohol dehydrogenase family)
MKSIQGKRVIVTGAAGIIGRRVCRAFVEEGARVALLDLDSDGLVQLAGELGGAAAPIACDVTQPESVARAVADAEAALGGIDVLHNNAASKSKDLARFFAPFEDYDLGTWREVMAVNVDGLMLMAQAVGKKMVQQGRGGSIVQTGSIYGVLAPDHRVYEGSSYLGMQISSPAVYSASKGAVIALTRYLAAWWAPHGIRVNTVTPGGVESGQNDEFQRRYSARVPMARMARADEIAATVLFLASDDASYVTGQNVIVDGGLSIW